MKFGLSSISLFPFPLKTTLRKASMAGFDFVEVFLFGYWDEEVVDYFRMYAEGLKLQLHFHQVWTTNSSEKKEVWINHALTTLGQLPPEEYSRREWIPQNARPFVAYAEELETSHLAGRDDVWFQAIASQCSLADRSPRLAYSAFLHGLRTRKLQTVFDTMHFIEYVRGDSGIEHSALATSEVLGLWERFWSEFHLQVREIHFNDFTTERNVWPGTGTAPLLEFADGVRRCGWDGAVVPEVRPRLPFPYGRKELLALRREMDGYFY